MRGRVEGRVEGRCVIITGGGSGIGRSFALALAAEGAKVAAIDLDRGAAEETAQAITSQGGEAIGLAADVRQRAEVSSAFDSVVEWSGAFDVIFTLAGFNSPMHFLDVTEENWQRVMDVNALGTLLCMQEAARRMIPRGGGKIVTTSSIAGRQGYPSFAPYSASKFAVNALTQAGARALAEHNITVNSIAPGVVDTPLWEQLDADLIAIGDTTEPGEAMTAFTAGIIRGRAAQPEDLIGTALFFASADSDYLTGQIFMVDGGMVLV
jgi:meso-butanediol dehydrogenase/(S,S)-butanediol dehydrogenase/diacetyl reductase